MPEPQDNYCCEEHYPSAAMTPDEQVEHVCPVCGWSLSTIEGGVSDA